MYRKPYRKPRTSVIDRHTLIEFDGDYTDYEMGHLLRKAYENHKAPHEYDDLKKYIRDMVIGEHNSVYPQNGNPTPLAAAAVLMPSNTLNTGRCGTNAGYDAVGNVLYGGSPNNAFVLDSSCGNLPGLNPSPWVMITYNNGNALGWLPIYTTASFQTLAQSVGVYFYESPDIAYRFPSSVYLAISPSTVAILSNNITPKYLYAPYITSTNPLTLSTYYYWTYPTSSGTATYSYVYFNGVSNNSYAGLFYTPIYPHIFYSTGTFTFNPGTTYITMWQWTYS